MARTSFLRLGQVGPVVVLALAGIWALGRVLYPPDRPADAPVVPAVRLPSTTSDRDTGGAPTDEPSQTAPSPGQTASPRPVGREEVPEDWIWPVFHGDPQLRGKGAGSLDVPLRLLWRFPTEGPVVSSPVIGHGMVYVGSHDQRVYAIDRVTGGQRWRYETKGQVEGACCVYQDVVYVGSSDGFLYALDARRGGQLWQFQTHDQIMGGVNPARLDGAVRVIVGSYDNRLYCLDGRTGQEIWNYESGNYINGTPALNGNGSLDDGLAIFGGCDALIHLVSLADGSSTGQIDTGSYIAGSAAVEAGRIYVGNLGGEFLCIDAERETVLWRFTTADEIFSTPAVGASQVVFGGRDGKVYSLDKASGDRNWSFATQGPVDSSPVICDDKVVVGSGDGRLYVLGLADGREIWHYEIGEPIVSSPAVADGVIYVGADDGCVYAFGRDRP